MTPVKKRSELPRKKPMLRAPLRLIGSKGKLAPYLLAMIPHHHTYVEAFGGGAALLFGKDPRISKLEVYNDVDIGLVNFFRVLRNPISFEKFVRTVRLTPYSRLEWRESVDSWRAEGDPVERAAKWFVVARQSFGGKFGGAWGLATASSSKSSKYGYLPMTVLNWLSVLDALPQFHWRLSRVQIEYLDWRRCLELYNSKNTFMYCDPPYVWGSRKSGEYEHEMSNSDHKELVEKLLEYKGMVMLSGYANPIYEPLEKAGWVRTDFNIQIDVAGSVRQSRRLMSAGAKQADRYRRIDSVWRNLACVENTPSEKD